MTLKDSAFLPYADPEEFIVEWTDRIWVQRGVGLIRQNYAPDAIVHGAYGTGVGVEPVVASTLAKISAFPDRVGQAEDVVWEARGDDAFLSSHRIFSSGTNSKHTVYGPPTHRRFSHRTIANCLYRNGVMEEEWVIRDELAVVQDLGLDPFEVARTLAFRGFTGSATRDKAVQPLTAGDSGARPGTHRDECAFVLDLFDTVLGQAMFHRLDEYIARDITCHTVGNRTLTRPRNYQESWMDLLAPFPDARIEVRDIVANDSAPHGGLRVGVVWWLTGTYSGLPVFGPVTGSRVEILGSSQFRLREGRIVEEWRVYDQLAVLAQLARARGDEPTAAPAASAPERQ